MNPQDYQVTVRKLADNFVRVRTNGDAEKRMLLLEQMRNTPAETQFHGYLVSSFHAYHTPQQCAWIIVSSESQNVDRQSWEGLPPRETLFAMAFEMLKSDVWQMVLDLLLARPGEGEMEEAGEQLTIFEAPDSDASTSNAP